MAGNATSSIQAGFFPDPGQRSVAKLVRGPVVQFAALDSKGLALQEADRLLPCSGRLTGMASDNEIARLLEDNREPEATARAGHAANPGGGLT